jgi:hypothetical protein
MFKKNGIIVSLILTIALLATLAAGVFSPVPVLAHSNLTLTGINWYTLIGYPEYLAYSGGKLLWSYGSSLSAAYERNLATYYTQHADNYGNYWGECVSSVKALSGSNAVTDDWVAGVNVVSSGSASQGTAIATFPSGSYSGHCAFFDSYVTTGGVITGIKVWDQNWYYIDLNSNGIQDYGEGVFGHHIISTSGGTLVTDADNYYVITVP